MILVSRTIFLGSWNQMEPFILWSVCLFVCSVSVCLHLVCLSVSPLATPTVCLVFIEVNLLTVTGDCSCLVYLLLLQTTMSTCCYEYLTTVLSPCCLIFIIGLCCNMQLCYCIFIQSP